MATCSMSIRSNRGTGTAYTRGTGKIAYEKRPRRDEIKAELLKVYSELSTEIIVELWNACRRCGELPAHWQKALLVPIHEKDRLEKSAKVIHMLVRKSYSFHVVQLCFQKGKGTHKQQF